MAYRNTLQKALRAAKLSAHLSGAEYAVVRDISGMFLSCKASSVDRYDAQYIARVFPCYCVLYMVTNKFKPCANPEHSQCSLPENTSPFGHLLSYQFTGDQIEAMSESTDTGPGADY